MGCQITSRVARILSHCCCRFTRVIFLATLVTTNVAVTSNVIEDVLLVKDYTIKD